jgi:thioredoxin reductase (NADPH)
MKSSYDIVIVGGGPAGITAGIYAAYDGNDAVIIEKNKLFWIPENHVNLLGKLEGYPGFVNKATGTELKKKFLESLGEMKVPYYEKVSVESIKTTTDGRFNLTVSNNKIVCANAVIMCTGTKPRNILDSEYNNVHYFAYGNYKQYVGKEVIVVGCRNSGATAAIYLANHGLRVTIVEKQQKPPAKQKHLDKLKTLGVNIVCGAEISKVFPDQGKVISVTIKTDGSVKQTKVAAMYYYVGIEAENKLLSSLSIATDSNGYIKTNTDCTTSIPGLFVAGDLCGGLKHIVKASGQGAQAAYSANNYIISSLN